VKDEKKLIMSLQNKSIGDIVELSSRLNKIENKLTKMEYIHKDITFDKDLENVDIDSDYVRNSRIDNDVGNMFDLHGFAELEN